MSGEGDGDAAAPVFLVMACKLPDQLGRLVRVLRAELPAARVLVHIDAKVDIEPFASALDGAGAELIDERVTVEWGCFSQVEAQLALIRRSLGEPYGHAVLLSEQCYPIRPLSELDDLLRAAPETEFIDMRHLRTEWPEATTRYKRTYPEFARRRFPKAMGRAVRVANAVLPPRRPPMDLDMYGGMTWWALPRAHLEAVLDLSDRSPRLRRSFRRCLNPDEMYVHTLLRRLLPEAIVQQRLTYDEFDPASPLHPLVWTDGDVPRLLATGFHFARKLDPEVDSRILNSLDVARAGA